VPSDFLRAKALGGAAGVSRATLQRAARQALAISSAGGSWEYVGANNIGGRVTDVVVDPTEANTIYVASAGGGVWKSTDAGIIGRIAVDPKDPQRVYVAPPAASTRRAASAACSARWTAARTGPRCSLPT
jgi:hypothetical protein